jgi:tetratricopeptide (TPR) repeat protein
VRQAIVCPKCRTKFGADRERCPKCRDEVVHADPVEQRAQSRRLARAAGGIFGAFVLVLGGLWAMRASGPEPVVTSKPGDPLAARRQAPPITAEPAAEPSAPRAAGPPPFLDPGGAATLAYGAGEYEKALAQFAEAIKRNPQDAEAMSNLGQVLVRLGRAGEALPYFERATSLNPDRWAYRFNYARALSVEQRWDESIASYKEAQRLFPNDYVTTYNLALTLHKKGDEPAAIEEYKKVIALQPQDASFRMALAISYERMQMKQEAAAEYAQYLKLAPSASDAEKVRTKIAQLTSQPAAAAPIPAPSARDSTTGGAQ